MKRSKMMTKYYAILISLYLLSGCKTEHEFSIQRTEIELETMHSGEPNLTVGQDESFYISWVEYANDSLDVLKFSKLVEGRWTKPKIIAQGHDWFVNWADFPSLVSVDETHFTAHWLQKSAEGTYDYDVRISQSMDEGNTWSPSKIPHKDGINAEHGFVTLVTTNEGKTFAVWLDGRNTKNKVDNAMTLRSAEIDREGYMSNEIELDRRVCDCCQTGATWTEQGPIVVYRDRSEDEIRDIGIIRKVNNQWTEPKSLFDDKWKIAGCPVNGPSIDSKENFVVVAWYTMSDDKPKVLATISRDYGKTFTGPIIVDQESPIGRVDVIIHNEKAIVSWMSNELDKANINIVAITKEGQLSNVNKIGRNSKARSSGFPRMESNRSSIVIAWTDTTDSLNIVKSYKVNINDQ